MTFAAVMDAVRSLSPQDRIQLMQAMLDDLAREQGLADLTEQQKAELDRRIAEDDADPTGGVSWEQMNTAARARHGR